MFGSMTKAAQAGLTAIIAEPKRAFLAFDFDGVLSSIVDDPEQSQPLPGMFQALADLAQQVGSVAIITGRPVSFLTSRDGFGLLASVPNFMIFGQYGFEEWDAVSQEIKSTPPNERIAAARKELSRLLMQPGIAQGSWLEDKGTAVAVHTRRTADPEGALAVLSKPVHDLAQRHHLRVEPGKMVLEIRPHGVSKGDVLSKIVQNCGWHSVLYAGDDLGDLSAFAIVDKLRDHDRVAGIKVCSGSAEAIKVADAADLVVDGPAGIMKLLTELNGQIAHRANGDTAR
jgi:trehalose 6-phosphate phosphatase